MRKLFTVRAVGLVAFAAVGAAFADQLPLQDTPVSTNSSTSKRGTILVEKYAPRGGLPRYRILSTHYEIYSELKPDEFPPAELGKVMEAVREQYVAFFGVDAKQEGERWPIELYGTPERFKEEHPDYSGANGVFLPNTGKAYTHRINGPLWWTRALMVHEATHQYHHRCGISGGTVPGTGAAKFPFVEEGVATFCEGHRWDPRTETVFVGAPLPGRSRHGTEESKARKKTFNDYLAAPLERDECFNLMMFLVHCRTRQTARLLRDPGDPAQAWTAAFGTLEPNAAFWSDYAKYQTKIGNDALIEKPGSIRFTTWAKMLGDAAF